MKRGDAILANAVQADPATGAILDYSQLPPEVAELSSASTRRGEQIASQRLMVDFDSQGDEELQRRLTALKGPKGVADLPHPQGVR